MTLDEKYKQLTGKFQQMGKVAVAFSGGVDSTLLLKLAVDTLKDNAFAITVKTPFSPTEDFEEAVEFCKVNNIKQQVIEIDVLKDEQIAANTPERCYLCKKVIFGAVLDVAKSVGAVVVDGTNADDAKDFRPGEQAILELGVVSPFKDLQLTKSEIRELSRKLRLATSEKPANACLATRIPTGCAIKQEALKMADEAERYLHSIGFHGCRVRVHGDLARIEVQSVDIEKLVQESVRTNIINALSKIGFRYVSLDVSGYRMGNMNL